MTLPEYRVLRSRRRTLSLEITSAGEVLIRAPLRLSNAAIRAFAESKGDWIAKHLALREERKAAAPDQPRLSAGEAEALRERAKELFPRRAAHYAPLLGVDYGRITVRGQHSRWGSCSAKGNLNFNFLLLLAPPEVLDYVVVHELCHRKEMNHSPRFWTLVESQVPDWRSRRAWLREHGQSLMDRLPEKSGSE
jgi:predicted metal-dependent hydrolase